MKIDLKSLGVFSYSMATCLSSGLSAKKSLVLSADKSNSKRLRGCLDSVILQIDGGVAISEALKTSKNLFPDFYLPVIKCGEESGRVVEAFNFLHDHCRKLNPTLKMVRKTWLYPVILIIVGWVVRIGIFVCFGSFRDAFILIQNTFIRYSIIVLLIYFLLKIRLIRKLAEWVRLQLPVIRETERDFSIALFFKTLNLMYKTAGMQVVRMFDFASSTIMNSIIQRDFAKARKGLESGESFGEAFGKLKFLPKVYKETISTGAVSGKLDECLDKISEMSVEAIDARFDILNRILWRIVTFNVVMSIVWTFYIMFFSH